MNSSIKNVTIVILIAGIVIGSNTGCQKKPQKSLFDIDTIQFYTDIPGITEEEIYAIETLKAEEKSFSFGYLHSTEAFLLPDDTLAGFSIKFVELLSSLFGAPFNKELHTWNSLLIALDDESLDFAANLILTPDRREYYSMTSPIAERTLSAFTIRGAHVIETEYDLNGLKIGFFEGTVTEAMIKNAYPDLVFEAVPIRETPYAIGMIQDGIIDAFIIDSVRSYNYIEYPFIQSQELFQLAYSSVSLTTGRPELAPFISAMNKYIAAGGVTKLHKMYKEGKQEYERYEFAQALTDEEKNFINELELNGSKIPIALENDNYPISFYNEKENEFQGIAIDVLLEISRLTGINFEVMTNNNTPWGVILEMLKAGEVSIVSQLLYTEERKGQFIWSRPYASSHYALLSSANYPDLEIYQVANSTVGIGRQSAYADLFKRWFPGNLNIKYYDSQNEVFDAMDKGEVDLIMGSEYVLLTMTNYREKSGYKTNILFNTPMEESLFGFNKNEELLCSISNKVLQFIETDRIEKNWTSRVFDYSRKIANERSMYLSISAVILFLTLIILMVFYLKNSKIRELYKNQLITLVTIYNSLPDLVYSKDINGKYISCNSSFEKFIGCPEAEIIGKTPVEMYTWDALMAYRLMAMDRKVLTENKPVKTEGWLFYPDLTRRLFEIVKVPFIRNGKVTGLLGINRDITKYKEAERAAQEASRAKSNFLAKMSHEIRTPMNAIIGMTELALRADAIKTAHKHILTVKQAGAHLLSIINDILDFSKIEMGMLEILPTDYLFSSLLNDVISIIRMRVIDSQIRFAVNIDSNIPNALIGDETRIRQVLLNVLNNAVKYTEKGFVTFTVRGKIIENDIINLSFEVMDSGKGIKQEDLKNLFGDYIQFDAENNRGIEGVGLGLAITWNIVKAMGGDITVFSEYGKGSTFTVSLPQKIHSPEILAKVENPEEINAIVYERREVFANSIKYTINNLNVECTLVSNDAEFREKLSVSSYNYIFISFKLLEKNRALIKQYAPNSKIVVLSEFGESIPDKDLSILYMPVHSISIANVFNGRTDNYNYSINNEHIVRFIAPTANILIVDDINTNLKVAEGLMLPYKMKVDLRQSGKEAIEAAKTNHYDIIFMDHKMPEMDGVVAMTHIRALKSDDGYYNNVPIVVLTANAVSGTREMFLQNGFSDFLSKPIDTIKLNSLLEKWIPKEKQNIQTGEYIPTEIPMDKKSDNIYIDGIDIERGIFLSGGSLDLYLETLAIFHKDGLKKIDEIGDCWKTNNLQLFSIYAHALKSAAANIGADALSSAAKDLEAAGEEGDLIFIESHLNSFISSLELLLEDLEELLAARNAKTEETKNSFDTTQIKEELVKLLEALNSLDAGTINTTIDKLKLVTQHDNLGAVIHNISEQILISEFDKAISLTESLLKEK